MFGDQLHAARVEVPGHDEVVAYTDVARGQRVAFDDCLPVLDGRVPRVACPVAMVEEFVARLERVEVALGAPVDRQVAEIEVEDVVFQAGDLQRAGGLQLGAPCWLCFGAGCRPGGTCKGAPARSRGEEQEAPGGRQAEVRPDAFPVGGVRVGTHVARDGVQLDQLPGREADAARGGVA